MGRNAHWLDLLLVQPHRSAGIGAFWYWSGDRSLRPGALTRSWFAALYLVLLWPAPYQAHLSSAIIHITDATVVAVDASLRSFNWSGVTAAGDAVYSVTGPNGDLQLVGIDSPCAGAAGMFGFLLVAIPAMYLLSASWLRKVGWLALGLALLWLLNIGRIFALFWMATTQGVRATGSGGSTRCLGICCSLLQCILMLYLGFRLGFRFERSS